jgi:hypothetical protein
MQQPGSRIFIFLIFLYGISCTEKKQDTGFTETTHDTIIVKPDKNKPDPSIAVKDDYTQLTREDEEKEDKTHMDMSYFPSNYALDKAQEKLAQPIIRVIYSRPRKSGRKVIFGDSSGVVPYNRIWRLGANESTEIEFLKPVLINNKKISAGRYTVYAIPRKDSWTIIFNNNLFTWGDFNYDASKDLVRVDVPVNPTKFPLETFLMYFQKTNSGCNMIMTWDTVAVSLPIGIP